MGAESPGVSCALLMSDDKKPKLAPELEKQYPVGARQHTQLGASLLNPRSREEKRRQAKQLVKEHKIVKVRPSIEAIWDDTLFALGTESHKIAKAASESEEGLSKAEVEMLVKMADALVKLRREERLSMIDTAEKIASLSDEELDQLLKED